MEIITKTKEETIKFGTKLANSLKSGDILCLRGELGAGKTTLVKGLAVGLGIDEEILSPTFVLMNIHEITNSNKNIMQIAHIDTYRLKNEEELSDIGAEDYLGAPNTICVIEWPEKIANLLNGKKVIAVKIERVESGRKI